MSRQPSIRQMRARMTGIHRRVLEAAAKGQALEPSRLADEASIALHRSTLVRWGAIDGNALTDIGHLLLGQYRNEHFGVAA